MLRYVQVKSRILILLLLVLPHTGTANSFVRTYTLDEVRQIASPLFESYKGKNQILGETDKEWGELNMPLLLEAVRRTKSQVGALTFEALLEPIDDTAALKKRQELVRALMDDELFPQLDAFSKAFAKDEGLFLHIIDRIGAQGDLLEGIPDMFKGLYQNTSLKFLLTVHLMSTAMLTQGLAIEARHVVLDWRAMRAPGERWVKKLWLGFNLLGQVSGLGVGVYFNFASLKLLLDKLPQADGFVVKMGQALGRLKALHDALQANPRLKDSPFAQKFAEFWSMSNPNLKSVVEAVQTRSSYEEKSFAFLRYWYMTDSLTNYDTLRRFPSSLAILLKASALLDAYLSVARLIREYREHGLAVSFASYKEGDAPAFTFQSLGNPLLKKTVPNDFELGLTEARHAVLTGPHACGKTTSMKSIAFAHILGQSLTIVPAEAATFVPLSSIRTYFNIGDKIGEGLSSFMSEHKRMTELREVAESLGRNDRILMLVDEPYAKTIQTIGEPRVTNFLRDLSKVPHLMVILATHFEEPSSLEAETRGTVKNFQPEVQGLESLEFKPSYKIVGGAAQWWFKDREKRDAFIDWLVK